MSSNDSTLVTSKDPSVMDTNILTRLITSDSSSSSFSDKTKNASTSPAVNVTAAVATTVNNDPALSQFVRRRFQNIILIWLDSNIDETKEYFKNALRRLRRVVASVTIFTDSQECLNFISEIKQEKIFMIVSGSLGQYIVPAINAWPQLDSIYIFCREPALHKQWSKMILKVKGIYDSIRQICEALQIDRETCDRSMIPITFCGIDPSFIYVQLLKEALLQIEDDDTKSLKEFIEYCRLRDDISKREINKIERKYQSHTPTSWYISSYFMYSMLNRSVQLMDVEVIGKMNFFFRHLYKEIELLHREQQQQQQQLSTKTPPARFRVFRGQGLSLENFEKMKKTEGGLLSVNNFLSASRNSKTSFHNYAYPATRHPDLVGILFVITIDPKICATSSIHFADVKPVGQNEVGEEILFSTHTIFRIDRIKRIHDEHTDRLWQVNLTPIGDGNHDMNTLTLRLRQELTWKMGWSRVSEILMRMGEPLKAEHLCKIELDKASSSQERADCNNQLGKLYAETGKYSRALSSYKQALQISMEILPTNHFHLADAYSAIGMIYFQMGEHSKALSSLKRSIDIQNRALITDDIKLVDSYDNIGMVYFQMGNYSKALSSFQRSLEIQKIGLPPNHLVLASSYTRIGNVYAKMNEHSEALSSFKKVLEIQKIGLPSKHPDFAETYKNIGAMYKNMGMLSKAVRSQERALQIKSKILSSNHQGLIVS
ncbi:unnamed protein product [Rotaria magnacalcarata]|uniref:Uncharacterized protein n=3 Tax=Rotaria magnacalcarata TaxID=392030 RepID=A0A816HE86_9BILA|nr:unnamed protein product [Rotaria magnacalcarata]CAF2189175.1 unnamed protein product [Rotaria magnacalcarata]CAF4429882.1 unnamed protein product [Rotaria magnacalcarata]